MLFILQCLVERQFSLTQREYEDFDVFHARISQAIIDDRSVGDTRDEMVRFIDRLSTFALTQAARDYLFEARQRAQARRMIREGWWQYCGHCGHEVRSNIRRGVIELYEKDDERLYFW